MAVMTTERPLAAAVRAIHDEIVPPEGYRVEIVEGKIEVSSTPGGKHAYILLLIRSAITPTLPAHYGLFENTTLEEPDVDRYIPDLAVWPISLINSEVAWAFRGDDCLLAVEVTTPDQERRDYAKFAGYARSRVPVYLLVDRKQRMCVLFTEPEGNRYRDRHEYPFGKPVTLSLDPPVTVETSEF
jgi:Uma2 family endonuclease